MMQHRIFLVTPLGAPPHRAQRAHWEQHHGPLFSALPGLRGYRQNRPLDAEWDAGRGWFCSETWFDDRRQEANSFDSDYYRDRVVPDEASFLDREGAWQAVVLDEDPPRPRAGDWRVLWFGDDPPPGPDWHGSDLTRPAPGAAGSTRLHSAWFTTEEVALRTASAVPDGVVAFACHPRSFLEAAPAREKAERA